MEIREALKHWRPASPDPRLPDLTLNQYRVLQFLRAHASGTGRVPTYRQIEDEFGFQSPHSVTQNFEALEKKGYLVRTPKGRRLAEVPHMA